MCIADAGYLHFIDMQPNWREGGASRGAYAKSVRRGSSK
jgi:hypothetical protein